MRWSWVCLMPVLLVGACSRPERVAMFGADQTQSGAASHPPPRNLLAEGVAPPATSGGGQPHGAMGGMSGMGGMHSGMHGGMGGAQGGQVTEVPKSFGTTTCAVSGDSILEFGTARIIEHEGQEIYLCCGGCIREFDKDPAYWMGKIEELRSDPGSNWVDSLSVSTQQPAPATPADASPPSEAVVSVDFERDIRPLFESNCLRCHGPRRQKSGYRLDTRATALSGGDLSEAHAQPAIIPGNADQSRLLWMLEATDDDFDRKIYPMPPDGPLESDEIARIRRWIEAGAPWPEGLELDGGR